MSRGNDRVERELMRLVRLAFSFTSHPSHGGAASWARIEYDDPIIDQMAARLHGRLVPMSTVRVTSGAVNRLIAVLWETTGGDWETARTLLGQAEHLERTALLRQLAGGLGELLNEHEVQMSPARRELELRRLALPQRATLSGAPPERLVRTRPGEPVPEAVRSVDIAERPLADVLAELDVLPGLEHVRRQVGRLVSRISVDRARRQAALPVTDASRHLALIGPPGTGKTMVARLVAEAYLAIGSLQRPVLVEAGRTALVGMYTGHTSHRTAETVAQAMGGVLFIDEAYSLVGDVFAAEALAELVRLMENHRHELVVILAGYPSEMGHLYEANPGLSSRIGHTLQFDSYDDDTLCGIFDLLAVQAGYLVTADAEDAVRQWLVEARADEDFANARTVRSLLEHMTLEHAERIHAAGALEGDELFTLTAADLPTRPQPASATPTQAAPGFGLGYL